jgi:hypothetical protein
VGGAVKSPIVKAVRQPLNLAVLLPAFVFGGCAAWWLLLVGLGLWLLMVIISAGDPELRMPEP